MSLLASTPPSRRNLGSINSSPPVYRYFTRAIGRKRVVSDFAGEFAFNPPSNGSSRKRRGTQFRPEMPNRLESLPQDLLIRVVCGVNHSDLKQLFFVSRTINAAALIAKESHFAFRTPSKPVSKTVTTFEGGSYLNAPDAPKQVRGYKSRINGNWLSSISVALFKSEEETLPKN